jgi:hypothetical protein
MGPVAETKAYGLRRRITDDSRSVRKVIHEAHKKLCRSSIAEMLTRLNRSYMAYRERTRKLADPRKRRPDQQRDTDVTIYVRTVRWQRRLQT